MEQSSVPVAPELVLEAAGRRLTLDPERSYRIGRDPQSDLVLEDSRVSWRHATVSHGRFGWVLEDRGSTNGTFLDGRRHTQVVLDNGAVVALGNPENGPRLNFAAAHPRPEARPESRPQPAPQARRQPQQAARDGARSVSARDRARPSAAAPAGSAPPSQVPHQGPAQGPVAAPVPVTPGQTGMTPVYGVRSPSMVRNLAHGMRTVRIGRGLDNELVVPDLQVSRHHAELRQLPDGGYEIADLGSHNGTFVNGQRVQHARTLSPTDIVGIGHSTFRLVGDRLEEFVDTGEISFSARQLTVEVEHKGQKKVLLNNVSFGVPEKSLVAVIGPSGSGKSTLLRALTGYRPADGGDVLYDGRNLYRDFAELRQRIGLVPQDDILHTQLTVRTALRYAARLRFPGDTVAAEREARVEEVLRELRLEKRAENRITALSGGQRKRVSVALELLTKPSLIFLDEPTSGLDPGMDREVMQMLRGLADDGRTVLVVTHSVAELALCDRLLVMAPGGAVAYFGPPEEALHFFGYDSWADVFQAFENYPDHDWSGRYRGSVHFQMYSADLEATPPQSASIEHRRGSKPKPQSWGSQLVTLVRRYGAVIAADRGFMLLSLILPAVLGVVSILIPDSPGFTVAPGQQFNANAATVLLLLAVGACFSGAANSVRELIKERVIYERERATGLSRSAYLMSKILVLGGISVVQGVIICGINFSIRKLPAQGLVVPSAPAIEMTIAVVLLSFVSMLFGLVISSLVKTAEKTMPLLVMFAIVQVVFTGSLFQIFGSAGVEQLSWLMPSRWAVAMLAATADLNHVMPPYDTHHNPPMVDALWVHTATQWYVDAAALLGLGLVFALSVLRLLRRHEPEVMRNR
ncbi:ABC transporter ATP-binding protein/permease [Phaeacidiphilus oryzae]|uniref:ABC transporter ATP-binding protein/permease n=1 Tax=Phaeacidiphilus oryzae TaxID=348818 RepID=UPI0005655D5B|nr:FHA domain-containing protein [Phaeacidiphilus oryzae]